MPAAGTERQTPGVEPTLVTMIGWRIQIEGRAFQCDDWVPFATFSTDMTNHRQAGDTLSPGWTWDGIENVGRVYQIVFWSLWPIGAGLCSILWMRKSKQNHTSDVIVANRADPQR